MKVLLHCVYYAPEVGGLESHVRGLAEGLAKRGHEVRVVTSRSRPDLPREEKMGGVNVRRTWMPSRSPVGWIAHSLGSVPSMRARGRWADVVHGQSFASAVPAGLAARAGRRPWVVSFHTSHFLERARRPLWRPVLGRLVRWPDRALAASQEIARVAESLAPGVHVEAITNGVDTDFFAPRAASQHGSPAERAGEAPTLIVPRRLVPKNGVETFVRAFPAVKARVPGVRALVAGDGPERARLEALARELGVASDIQFLGACPHERMPGLLASAQVAVVPSLMEATSVAALEALACGLPVVASDVGGLPEIVDRSVGALVSPGDPAALADAIVAVLSDPNRAAKGLLARRRVVEKWSNDRLVERHLEIYGELLAGAARSGHSSSSRR